VNGQGKKSRKGGTPAPCGVYRVKHTQKSIFHFEQQNMPLEAEVNWNISASSQLVARSHSGGARSRRWGEGWDPMGFYKFNPQFGSIPSHQKILSRNSCVRRIRERESVLLFLFTLLLFINIITSY